MVVKIEREWCKGCGVCIERCPLEALEFSKEMNKKGYFPPEMKPNNKCNNCRLCELVCPDLAIGVFIEEEGKDDGKTKKAEDDGKTSEDGCGCGEG